MNWDALNIGLQSPEFSHTELEQPITQHADSSIPYPKTMGYFSEVDVRNGFSNIGVNPHLSRFFCVHFQNRRLRFTRLVQGCSPSPCIFHGIMASIMKRLIVVVCIDDVLVGEENPDLHNQAVSEVMRRLQKYEMKIKKENLEIGRTDLEFLQFWLTRRELPTTTGK